MDAFLEKDLKVIQYTVFYKKMDSSNWKGHRECHLLPDWLLIYICKADSIIFTRTGSHSYLFK